MLKEDLEQIAELLTQTNHVRTSDKVTDFLSKIGVAACVLGLTIIGNNLTDMSNKLDKIEDEQIINAEWRKVEKAQTALFNQFMQQPRFTKDNYLEAMQPYDYRLTVVEALLNERKNTVSRAKENEHRSISNEKKIEKFHH